MVKNIRHEGRSDCLEEERNTDVKTSEVCAKTEAKGENAGEEGDDREEQRDQVESEHEPAHVEELGGVQELFRNVGLSAEVARRVEGQGSLCATAVSIASILFTAEREESPACRVVGAARDVVGGSLEEVSVADRAGVDNSREDDEELEDNAASKDDQSDQAEDGT